MSALYTVNLANKTLKILTSAICLWQAVLANLHTPVIIAVLTE